MSERFASIPAPMIFSLSGELLRLYGIISMHDWRKDGSERQGCILSLPRLAELCGKQVRQTQRDLARLKRCRAIDIESRPSSPHRIFCTPERFDPSLVKTKQETPPQVEEIPKVTNDTSAIQDTPVVQDTGVTKDTQSQISDRPSRPETTVAQTPQSQANPPVKKDTGVLNDACQRRHQEGATKDTIGVSKKTPEIETENKNKSKRQDPPYPQTPLQPGGLAPRSDAKEKPKGYALYPALRVLKEAAGDALELGELIPAQPPPAGFAGCLRDDLEFQFRYKITGYGTQLELEQASLEARLKRLGQYIASRKNRHLRSGQISLRTLCLTRQTVFEELMDEAQGKWDQTPSTAIGNRTSPSPSFPKRLHTEQAQAQAKRLTETAFAQEESHEPKTRIPADW